MKNISKLSLGNFIAVAGDTNKDTFAYLAGNCDEPIKVQLPDLFELDSTACKTLDVEYEERELAYVILSITQREAPVKDYL